jgi:hypothetical protein
MAGKGRVAASWERVARRESRSWCEWGEEAGGLGEGLVRGMYVRCSTVTTREDRPQNKAASLCAPPTQEQKEPSHH